MHYVLYSGCRIAALDHFEMTISGQGQYLKPVPNPEDVHVPLPTSSGSLICSIKKIATFIHLIGNSCLFSAGSYRAQIMRFSRAFFPIEVVQVSETTKIPDRMTIVLEGTAAGSESRSSVEEP